MLFPKDPGFQQGKRAVTKKACSMVERKTENKRTKHIKRWFYISHHPGIHSSSVIKQLKD
jgi:hypothetical protein